MITTIGKVVNCIFINIGEIKLPKKGQKSGYNIQCENCGNTEWQGKLIPLEVHHIDEKSKRYSFRFSNVQNVWHNLENEEDLDR